MLSDHDRELICAAVDGQLSIEQESEFRTIIAESAAALQLYQVLQSHARRIQALPVHPAPQELWSNVMAQVRSLPTPKPIVTPRPAAEKPVGYVHYIVAASLFIGVTASAFWFASDQQHPRVATNQRKASPATIPVEREKSIVDPVIAQAVPENLLPAPRLVETPRQAPVVVAKLEPTPELAPAPHPHVSQDVIGAATLTERSPLTAVNIRTPFLANVSELDGQDTKQRLREELSHDAAYRIDLFASDTQRAATIFQNVCKKAQINVSTDAVAQERMKKKLPSAWVIYVESLDADELTTLFAALATQSRADDKPSVFNAAHCFPTQLPDARDMKELFGIDLGMGKRQKSNTGKPASTIDQVASALQKHTKSAMMLTYLPAAGRTNPNQSAEIQSFLAKREDRKPGSVPMMIVIRPAN